MREPSFYVGKPIRSLQTILRVLSKTRSDQPSVIPDGIYGDDTQRAVSAFQRSEHLPSTGVADSETWDHLVRAYAKESPLVLPAEPLEIIWQPNDKIRPGERSLHLFLIQAMLKAISEVFVDIPKFEITGIHDEPSVACIKWIQEKSGLPATGEIDQTVWKHLAKLYRQTAGDGKSTYPEKKDLSKIEQTGTTT